MRADRADQMKVLYHIQPRPKSLALAIALAAINTPLHADNSLTLLGKDTSGGYWMLPAVSGDGNVVVGSRIIDSDIPWLFGSQAFRWSASQGFVELGDAEAAHSANYDGSVVVGTDGEQAYRWTAEGGMVGLGFLPDGSSSVAYGVNKDGSVVVGSANVDAIDVPVSGPGSLNFNQAFRWEQSTGMIGLGGLVAGGHSSAFAVSGDGKIVVGSATTGAELSASGVSLLSNEAFRWTESTGMVGLGALPGHNVSNAKAISEDGQVIVGTSSTSLLLNDGVFDTPHVEAFRWDQDGGMVGLGSLSGYSNSDALAVNRDGSVIVGFVDDNTVTGTNAFRWTQATGMQLVKDWLTSAGVAVAPGVKLDFASGVSADGSVVVGSSSTATTCCEAYIARVSAHGNGEISLSDLQSSLAGSYAGSQMALTSASTLLNGALSRPLARRVASGKNTFWLGGDWGRDDHGSRDGDLGLAQAAIGHNFGWAQINLGAGYTWAQQDLSLASHAETNGTFLNSEMILPVAGDFWLTLGGYGHWADAELLRGYLNAGMPDTSYGNPYIDTMSYRVQLDWEHALALWKVDVSPYVNFSYTEARMNAYDERGGGFPVHFNARTDRASEVRFGMNLELPVADKMKLLGVLEGTHRFEQNATRNSGQVIGLYDFDLPGAHYQQDWFRGGLGAESQLPVGKASLMVNATTRGQMLNFWMAANWQLSF